MTLLETYLESKDRKKPSDSLAQKLIEADIAAGKMMGAPIGNDGCAIHFPWPVRISELRPDPLTADWIIHGILRPESITLLTARPKAGKTTFVSHLLAILDRDSPFCGLPVKPARALVVSEETPGQWAERADHLAIGDHVLMMTRFLKKRLDVREWNALILHLLTIVRRENTDVVVIDPLPNFWFVRDENNAAEVHEALAPLRQLSETGAALLLLMHPRKSGGDEGTATRGSSAIAGFGDILLDLRRLSITDPRDRRRVLTGLSRFAETPAELVIELADDERSYVILGDRAQASRQHRITQLTAILPVEGDGLTAKEIRDAWPEEEPKPGLRTVEIALKREVEAGHVIQSGAGAKNDPRRFWRREEGQGGS